MATAQADNCYWQFNTDFFDQVSRDTFDPASWQRQQLVTGKETGRGTTWFLQHGERELVLRHYLRGGLVGKINKDSYLFTTLSSCRSLHEFQILEDLTRRGLPVPRPAAAQVLKHGLFYQADLLIERIPGAKDLVSLLKQKQPESFFASLGELIARFHSARVYHADLNIKNILQDSEGQFWLIDFDRARLDVAPGPLQNRSLKRLQRSFHKEKDRHGIVFEHSDWETLSEAYRRALIA